MLQFSLAVSLIIGAFSALPDVRPPENQRTFTSSVIDNLITTLRPHFLDADLGTLFSNCLPNTLDTTVSYFGPAQGDATSLDSFIITGDITALWLRDSANQVMPYVPYAPQDAHLNDLITGLINRHAKSVNIDSFANSFNFNASGEGHQSDMRKPPMTASVFEGKYEVDSLCAFLKLSYWHWHYSGDSVLSTFTTSTWMAAVDNLLNTINSMIEDPGTLPVSTYLFRRETSEALDTLIMQGRGPPGFKCGLTRQLFRPSDDAVTLPYNIPGNAMACVELTHLHELLLAVQGSSKRYSRGGDEDLTARLAKTASVRDSICSALSSILASSTVDSSALPYEVDGGAGAYYMDDANIPSLLSLPVLGYMDPSHGIYQRTRDFVLSEKNPYFFSGVAGEGIGGPHVGIPFAWPMGITVRAMTSGSDDEIVKCLQMLVSSSAGTGFMHESFNVHDVKDFTRKWFAWANGLLGELLLQLIKSKPHLVLNGTASELASYSAMVQVPVSLAAQGSAVVR